MCKSTKLRSAIRFLYDETTVRLKCGKVYLITFRIECIHCDDYKYMALCVHYGKSEVEVLERESEDVDNIFWRFELFLHGMNDRNKHDKIVDVAKMTFNAYPIQKTDLTLPKYINYLKSKYDNEVIPYFQEANPAGFNSELINKMASEMAKKMFEEFLANVNDFKSAFDEERASRDN